MFANVHKGELSLIGGTMVEGTDYKWQVPTMDTRLKEIGKLQKFCEELPLDISENSINRKKLDFMASNGLRQMGIPRINIYADRQRPEPFHSEVNNWQHVLNLLYTQCVKKNQVEKLVTLLKASVTEGGCGMKSIGHSIEEHYVNENTRDKKLTERLIRAQAILLPKYGLRLVDLKYIYIVLYQKSVRHSELLVH